MNLNPCPACPRPDNLILAAGQNLDWNALRLLPERMPYLILETAEDGIQFISIFTEKDFNRALTVLRLHSFGLGGDLQVRVDEQRVHWRFVGERTVFDQLGLAATQHDFHPGPLSMIDKSETALLWGKYDADDPDDAERGRRYEARMGRAPLDYPDVPLEYKRVNICACPVRLDSDQRVIAYWTYALAEHQPESQKEAGS
ncbi:MAG: hypothetical protein JNM70_02120 [Anaerolineae bacterium]|nr:hypothetical protein [Anaerolineae bacterium]